MENQEVNICNGCLSSGRKMVPFRRLSEKLCLSQLFSDLLNSTTDESKIMLCWECVAITRRFAEFKARITEAHLLLEKKFQNPSRNQLSTLKTKQLYNISITDYESNSDFTPIAIKIEDAAQLDEDFSVIKIEDVPPLDENFLVEDSLVDDRISDCDGDKVLEKSPRKSVRKKRKKKVKIKEKQYKEIALTRDEIEQERKDLSLREDYVNAMFRCESCVVTFPNADDLSDHFSGKHELNASNYKCDICECTFSKEVSYNYHTNKHKKRYQCIICTERFLSKHAVMRHYEFVHCHGTNSNYGGILNGISNGEIKEAQDSNIDSTKPDQPSFPCEYCEKTFKWKTSLRKHIETHRIETGQKRKPYCEPCNLSFARTSNLQKHVNSSGHQIQLKLRKLASEKKTTLEQDIKDMVTQMKQKFRCEHCGKHFQWKGNLLRHLNSHAARAKGELVCEPCGRSFSSIATYRQHMQLSRKHVSENDFKYMCSDCGKKFATKMRLKDHIDWEHLKNYVHKCNVCSKVFKSHTSLYIHKQAVHRKYNAEHLCDHCGKSFPNRGKLSSHIIAMHTTESPYKCSVCSAQFSWHSCLSRHVKRVHRHHSLKNTENDCK